MTFNNGKLAEISQSGELSILDASGALGSGFRPGGTPVLPYGSTRTLSKFVCSSESTGMTCKSRTTNLGFTIDGDGITAYSPQPVNPPAPQAAPPPTPDQSGDVYYDTGSGHWIDDVSDDGSVITLEDGSHWLISPLDQVDTQIWLAVDEITVVDGDDPSYPYKLVNTDEGETAEAQFIGTG